MKKENSGKFEIDDLIKQMLKDDLPPELENRMKKQLNLFREKMEQFERQRRQETRGALWRLFHGEELKGMKWMFKKQVLASASIIMVILGVVLQITGPRSILAESISLLKTSVLVSDEVSRAVSMEYSMQVPAENGQHFEYSIKWLSSNLTRVQIKKPNLEIVKTMWISEKEITIADHTINTLRKVKKMKEINDPHFQPIMGLLSPLDLVERMDGKWRLKQYAQHGDCEWGTFTIAIPEEKTFLEFTVDLCNFLPTNFKEFITEPTKENGEGKILMNVNFKWNTPISPQLMLPEITKGST